MISGTVSDSSERFWAPPPPRNGSRNRSIFHGPWSMILRPVLLPFSPFLCWISPCVAVQDCRSKKTKTKTKTGDLKYSDRLSPEARSWLNSREVEKLNVEHKRIVELQKH